MKRFELPYYAHYDLCSEQWCVFRREYKHVKITERCASEEEARKKSYKANGVWMEYTKKK